MTLEKSIVNLLGWGADQEGRVVVDKALELGRFREVTHGESTWVVHESEKWCAPHLHDYERLSPFEWGNTTTAGGPLTGEQLAKAFRQLMHPHCPLLGCEDFDFIQRKVPRAVRKGETVWTTEFEWQMPVPRHWFRLVMPGNESPQVREWLNEMENVIAPLVDPINWRLEPFGVPDYRHVVRIAGVDLPKAQPTPKPDPSPKSKVPRFLRERQPRLDGR